jgi:starch-binding outer membrane protein, SusD/RagB family
MQNRWKPATWVPFTASNPTEALHKVRQERRKELVWRGTRWADIRRYNLEDSSITLKRVINGITYTLPPNDIRGVLLISKAAIDRGGIQQNPR